MCFSDRLSCHGYWANFFRLFLSALVYEMFLLKNRIRKTTFQEAWTWRVDKIFISLLKVEAILRKSKRRIYYRMPLLIKDYSKPYYSFEKRSNSLHWRGVPAPQKINTTHFFLFIFIP